ncbi:MAG: threonine/serine exporter family protein [Oscillospiraceae bacterium]|nr:threonine/serine exporter family protein [Oscillospiraceae bacterium]
MTVVTTYLLPCLWAFLACLGFSIIFNMRGLSVWIACFGGALGWLVYLLCGSDIPAAFFAAIVIGVFSEFMARLRHCPVTGYVLISLLPLVPGGGIYRSMAFALAGDTSKFLSVLLNTLGIAAALAVGSMVSSSLFRTVYSSMQRAKEHRSQASRR